MSGFFEFSIMRSVIFLPPSPPQRTTQGPARVGLLLSPESWFFVRLAVFPPGTRVLRRSPFKKERFHMISAIKHRLGLLRRDTHLPDNHQWRWDRSRLTGSTEAPGIP